MDQAIVLEGVTKTFGPKVAVRDLDLVVPEGSIWGFIGPNGAGKTTTIRMILSILMPDRGALRILGRDSALEAKDEIGYLPEERGLYKRMRVGAFLEYIARLKGRKGREVHDVARSWLERVGLLDVESKRCEELSKGMQQKVQFAAAVINDPRLLILDEPFSGLDPVSARIQKDLVLEQHRRGATILFSTHVMSQAEEICDHVVMLADGAKVLEAKLSELLRRFDPHTLIFEPLDPAASCDRLGQIAGIREVTANGSTWTLKLAEGTDAMEAMSAAVRALPAARVELRRPTLEDIFFELVTSAGPRG